MGRRPQRYGKRQLLGWKAYKAWTPIGAVLFADEGAAKLECVRHAKHELEWEVSVRTPEGHPSWNGARTLLNRSASETYQASPHLEAYREDVPGAEFVSEDPSCNIYVAPDDEKGWAVFTMVDLEGRDPLGVMMLTGGSSVQDGIDAARLWTLFEYGVAEKERAIAFGRFLWGRQLCRQNAPRAATAGKLREMLRRLAVRWL
jgi:hypothetical protein